MNILLSPLLVAQIFFKVVRVKHDCSAEEIGQVLWLTFLSTYKVIREESLVLLDHESNERASRSNEWTLLLDDLAGISTTVHMVINNACYL